MHILEDLIDDLQRWQRRYRRNMGDEADCELELLIGDLKAIEAADRDKVIQTLNNRVKVLESGLATSASRGIQAETSLKAKGAEITALKTLVEAQKERIAELEREVMCGEVW